MLGLQKLSESVRDYAYLILTSQISTRGPIVGHEARNPDAQDAHFFTMSVRRGRDFSSSSKCEYCHQTNDVELRKSDMMVCQSCYDVEEQEVSVRKEDETQENSLLNEDIGLLAAMKSKVSKYRPP